jgi:hypothetical protein
MLASRNSPEPHLQRVYDSTVGVCFLGTPHCGSTLANWATVFSQIAGTVKKINTELLRVLQPESEVLARIQGDFHAMLRNRGGRPPMAITCFYEELPVKGVGEVVPKHSAILPAYNSIGLYSNHIDMAKFSGEEDPGYLSVSSELMRWVRAIQRAREAGMQSNAAQARSASPWADNTQSAPDLPTSPWATEPVSGFSHSQSQPQSQPAPANNASPYSPHSQNQNPNHFPPQGPPGRQAMQQHHQRSYEPSSDQLLLHRMQQMQQMQQGWQKSFSPPSTSTSPAPAPQIFRGGNVINGYFDNKGGTFVQGGTVMQGGTTNNVMSARNVANIQGGVFNERFVFN